MIDRDMEFVEESAPLMGEANARAYIATMALDPCGSLFLRVCLRHGAEAGVVAALRGCRPRKSWGPSVGLASAVRAAAERVARREIRKVR